SPQVWRTTRQKSHSRDAYPTAERQMDVQDKRGWPVTPRSPDLVRVHCEALGKGLWDGDPGPLTQTHPEPLPFMCAPLH
ncbi:hypothetical protein KUCAC02_017545, partial [Chaenocephalus aceratus]